MQTTLTNECAAAYQDDSLYIEGANPEMQPSKVETSIKTSIK